MPQVLSILEAWIFLAKLSLEKDEGLEVGRLEIRLRQFDRYSIVDALQNRLLVSTQLDVFKLRSCCHDFENTLQLSATLEGKQECLHRDEGDVVVSCNHRVFQRRNRVFFLVELDNLGIVEIFERLLNLFGQVGAKAFVRGVCQAVEARVG